MSSSGIAATAVKGPHCEADVKKSPVVVSSKDTRSGDFREGSGEMASASPMASIGPSTPPPISSGAVLTCAPNSTSRWKVWGKRRTFASLGDLSPSEPCLMPAGGREAAAEVEDLLRESSPRNKDPSQHHLPPTPGEQAGGRRRGGLPPPTPDRYPKSPTRRQQLGLGAGNLRRQRSAGEQLLRAKAQPLGPQGSPGPRQTGSRAEAKDDAHVTNRGAEKTTSAPDSQSVSSKVTRAEATPDSPPLARLRRKGGETIASTPNGGRRRSYGSSTPSRFFPSAASRAVFSGSDIDGVTVECFPRIRHGRQGSSGGNGALPPLLGRRRNPLSSVTFSLPLLAHSRPSMDGRATGMSLDQVDVGFGPSSAVAGPASANMELEDEQDGLTFSNQKLKGVAGGAKAEIRPQGSREAEQQAKVEAEAVRRPEAYSSSSAGAGQAAGRLATGQDVREEPGGAAAIQFEAEPGQDGPRGAPGTAPEPLPPHAAASSAGMKLGSRDRPQAEIAEVAVADLVAAGTKVVAQAGGGEEEEVNALRRQPRRSVLDGVMKTLRSPTNLSISGIRSPIKLWPQQPVDPNKLPKEEIVLEGEESDSGGLECRPLQRAPRSRSPSPLRRRLLFAGCTPHSDTGDSAASLEGGGGGGSMLPDGSLGPTRLGLEDRERGPGADRGVLGRGLTPLTARYEVKETLGEGRHGVLVRSCVERATGRMFAVKSNPKRSPNGEPRKVDTLLAEIAIMDMMRGRPGIVQLHEVVEDAQQLHVVMELCEGGDLLTHINSSPHITEAQAATFCRLIASALKQCHDAGVMHRDLKPENVLITGRGPKADVRLADFGISALLAPGQRLTGYAGSPYYVAPEVLTGEYGFEADVWSLGVTLYVLLSLHLPFWDETDTLIYQAILLGRYDTSTGPWLDVSPGAIDLVRQMLTHDPRRRITLNKILEHPWILRNQCELSQLVPAASEVADWKLSKRRRAIARAEGAIAGALRISFCMVAPDRMSSSDSERAPNAFILNQPVVVEDEDEYT